MHVQIGRQIDGPIHSHRRIVLFNMSTVGDHAHDHSILKTPDLRFQRRLVLSKSLANNGPTRLPRLWIPYFLGAFTGHSRPCRTLYPSTQIQKYEIPVTMPITAFRTLYHHTWVLRPSEKYGSCLFRNAVYVGAHRFKRWCKLAIVSKNNPYTNAGLQEDRGLRACA